MKPRAKVVLPLPRSPRRAMQSPLRHCLASAAAREAVAALPVADSVIELIAFINPCHLDGFEDFFIAAVRRIVKTGQTDDPLAQIGEAHIDVIGVGMHFLEPDGDLLYINP